jgi:hypothetical protein
MGRIQQFQQEGAIFQHPNNAEYLLMALSARPPLSDEAIPSYATAVRAIGNEPVKTGRHYPECLSAVLQ